MDKEEGGGVCVLELELWKMSGGRQCSGKGPRCGASFCPGQKKTKWRNRGGTKGTRGKQESDNLCWVKTSCWRTHAHAHVLIPNQTPLSVCLSTHNTSCYNLHFLESLAPLPRQHRPTSHTQDICHFLVYWRLQDDRILPPSFLIFFDTTEKRIVRKGLSESKQIDEKTTSEWGSWAGYWGNLW